MTTEERFWHHVNKTETCWLWTGSRNSKGYGWFGVNRKVGKAHRFSWELANGPIPTGLFVCHRCDNPACVRPDHLFLGTVKDNNRDAKAKGRKYLPGPIGTRGPDGRWQKKSMMGCA